MKNKKFKFIPKWKGIGMWNHIGNNAHLYKQFEIDTLSKLLIKLGGWYEKEEEI